MKKMLPFISIITVNYNGRRFLEDCFKSLSTLHYPKKKLEIIMIDNGSTDDSLAFVKKRFPKVKIIKNNVNNYCRANNLGMRHAKGKYVAILNNDTKADKNWLMELVKAIESDKSLGAVGSKIFFMDGKIESVGQQELPNFYWSDKIFEDYSQFDKPREVNSLCGCAVLYRRNALEDAGYFDEDFNMYMEDVDISIRMKRKKWRLLYVPESLVYHIHRGTAKEDTALFYTERNRLLLVAKYYPEKLCSALLGRGYFTAKRDINAQGSLYKILIDIVTTLIKHHKIEIVRKVLDELFTELKKISNYENSILTEKITNFLKLVESQATAIKAKDIYITDLNQELEKQAAEHKAKDEYLESLNLEIERKGAALREKDGHIDNLNQTLNLKDTHIDNLEEKLVKSEQVIKDIYNSTAFRFLVGPLWKVLWKIKQFLRHLKIFNLSSQEFIASENRNNTVGHNFYTQEGDIGICTIISKNYLAYARVLTDSFLEYNKGRVFVLLVDKIDGYFDPDKEKFSLIEIDSIKDRIPDFDKFSFQYNITELNTAVKPFFLEYLFEKFKLKKIIFFDPDILITNNLNPLFKLLDEFSIILIPHITKPFCDNIKPTEIDILKSGVYNLGFLALSYTDSTKKLLQWWKERLMRYCISDVENGLFVDQKWIDFIPGFFEDVYILRDKSYNIAYWNYHYRKVHMENSRILIDEKLVNFLHFSGLDPEDMNSVSRHQDRFKLKDLSIMQPIFELYKDKLIACGHNEFKDWPCVFNYFDNGVKIADIIRRIYWEMDDEMRNKFGNPFNSDRKNSYFNWLNEAVDNKRPKITRLMIEIYKKRLDVQLVYRDIFNSDRQAFVRWFLISTKREYHLDDSFLAGINSVDTKYVWMGVKPRIVYKIRNIFRMFCRRLFKNNLNIISKLRTIEIQLYKKIGNFSRSYKKDTNDLRDSQGKKGINILGYINAEHGVGEAVRANIRSLKAIGIDVSLINITPSYIRQGDFAFSEFSYGSPFFINLIHINADMLPMLYAEKGENYFKNKYNIGFWNWELSDFPEEWRESFDYCNEIWVPSSFSLASISKKSPVPVIKIPFAVSINKLKDVKKSYFGLKDSDFIFLFIFDFLSYFERKNPLAIIEAFKKAFSSKEARLVIKCCNPSFAPQAMNSLREFAKGFNIDIIDRYFYREEINTLISLCDCYVSLHRSEGFGLTMAEAMFLEKPVIATAYSGNIDFMNVNNSYLVKYKLVQIENDVGPYKRGFVWAEPDVEYAAELMRDVYENKIQAEEIGKIAAADIRKNFNFNVIGNEIKKRIDYLNNNNFI